MKKLVILFLVLFILLAIPFFIWGESGIFQPEQMEHQLRGVSYAVEGIAILALVADIALPVPATAVMTGVGMVRSFWWAFGVCLIGVYLSALIAYALARWVGRPAVRWMFSDAELAEVEEKFDRHGMAFVLLSRVMPIMPEAASLLAGIGRMSFRKFLLAVTLGSVPFTAFFVGIGVFMQGQAAPVWLTLAISAGLPVLLAAAVELWAWKPGKEPDSGAEDAR